MPHDEEVSNNTQNRIFVDILKVYSSRRKVLAGGIGTAVSSFLAGAPVTAQASSLVGFDPVPVAGGNGIDQRVFDDYYMRVILPFGDPLYPRSQDSIGIGHDGMFLTHALILPIRIMPMKTSALAGWWK